MIDIVTPNSVFARFASLSKFAKKLGGGGAMASAKQSVPRFRRPDTSARAQVSGKTQRPVSADQATTARVPNATPTVKTNTAASERARVTDVFASEHSVGRERMAAHMLAASMSATEITGLLAKLPRAAVRNVMLERLAADPNPRLGSGNADAPSAESRADRTWAKLWGGNA